MRPAVGNNPNIPLPVNRELRTLAQVAFGTQEQIDDNAVELQNKVSKSESDLSLVSQFVGKQLSAGGKYPLSIASLPGRAAQNQYAYVPVVQTLPSKASSLSTIGQAVWFNGQIYVYVPSGSGFTLPGVWQSATTGYSKIDPRRYGAVADGVTDDSAAISSAITVGKGLYLEAGSVFGMTWAGIASAIGSVSNGFTIFGGGVLRLLSGGTPLLTLSSTVTVIRILGVMFDGNLQTGSNAVIFLNGATQVYLNSVFVFGNGTNPALFSTTVYYDARGCYAIPDNIGFV